MGIPLHGALKDVCMTCYHANREYGALSSLSFNGEAAQDGQDHDLSLLERIMEEHPNHETKLEDDYAYAMYTIRGVLR